MLSELSGSGPVLLALTGNDFGRAKRRPKKSTFWKGVRKVASYTPAGLTVRAVKAAKAAADRKRADNIKKLAIQRANRARELAEARKRQAEAESAAKKAQMENAATPAAPSYSPAAPAPEYEAPVEEVNETPDAPAEETEEIQETTEEGAEEGAEVMGYARTNDDYFVGAPLKSPVSKIKAAAMKATGSGQLRLVKKVEPPNKKLLIVGGLVVGAYLFRKQLSRVFK